MRASMGKVLLIPDFDGNILHWKKGKKFVVKHHPHTQITNISSDTDRIRYKPRY